MFRRFTPTCVSTLVCLFLFLLQLQCFIVQTKPFAQQDVVEHKQVDAIETQNNGQWAGYLRLREKSHEKFKKSAISSEDDPFDGEDWRVNDNDKRTGIETPIAPLSEDETSSHRNEAGDSNVRSKVVSQDNNLSKESQKQDASSFEILNHPSAITARSDLNVQTKSSVSNENNQEQIGGKNSLTNEKQENKETNTNEKTVTVVSDTKTSLPSNAETSSFTRAEVQEEAASKNDPIKSSESGGSAQATTPTKPDSSSTINNRDKTLTEDTKPIQTQTDNVSKNAQVSKSVPAFQSSQSASNQVKEVHANFPVSNSPNNNSPVSTESEPIRDAVGNSGNERVTTEKLSYADERSTDGKESNGGSSENSASSEIGHFQVDDKSADLEINANSAGVKVKAKPASLQVVSRPGAHPPQAVVPMAPMYHHMWHHHHWYPGFRRGFPYRRHHLRRHYRNPYGYYHRSWMPRRHRYFYSEMPYRRHFRPHLYHHRRPRHYYVDPYMAYSQEMFGNRLGPFENPMSPYRRSFPYPFNPFSLPEMPYGPPQSAYMMPEGFMPEIPLPDKSMLGSPPPQIDSPAMTRQNILTPNQSPVNVGGYPPPGIMESLNNGLNGFVGGNTWGGFGQLGEMNQAMGGYGMRELNGFMRGWSGRMGDTNEQLGQVNNMGAVNNGFMGGMKRNVPEFSGNVKKTEIQTRKEKRGKSAINSAKTSIPHKNIKSKYRSHSRMHLSRSKTQQNHLSKAKPGATTHLRKGIHKRNAENVNRKSKQKNSKQHVQKSKVERGSKKNSIVIHRPPIIYHPPPEVYHRPDIVVHRAPIMLHRPPIVYHQPPVVVHRPAIIYHQPAIVFHQPPPVVNQPVLQSHDTWVTRPQIVHTTSTMSHSHTYYGVPDHVYGGTYMDCHGPHCSFRKHSIPHHKSTRGKTKNKTNEKTEARERKKREAYADYLIYLGSLWTPRQKRDIDEQLNFIASSSKAKEGLTYLNKNNLKLSKRDSLDNYDKFLNHLWKHSTNDEINRKKKKDVVVNRPPIIYHPPPEIYHRPDIVVHRPPLVIHRPPIIYHQPPVIVHRPAVVYHQPPIVFHQPPPAVSQPLLYSHDSFTLHPSFYATHHGSIVRDFGHYVGVPNMVTNYGSPLFHSPPAFGKRSGIPHKAKRGRSKSKRGSKKSSIKKHIKADSTEQGKKKNAVVIRRPPIIYHPPPEVYHRPDIVVHRPPIMIHRAPVVYHQPPVVVHRPAIVYHQPSIIFHQPPPVVHQPIMKSRDTWVSRPVLRLQGSRMFHHAAYIGVPTNYHWGHGWSHHSYRKNAWGKSKIPKRKKLAEENAASRSKINKSEKHKKSVFKKSRLKKEKSKTEKGGKKHAVIVKRPPVIYHPPPEVFHRPDIVVHRPSILVHRAPIVYHQAPVVVHRPAIVYHQPPLVFHQPTPMIHQPIYKSHDTWVQRPVYRIHNSMIHHWGSITHVPHAYYHGHGGIHFLAYGKSKVPASKVKAEPGKVRDTVEKIQHSAAKNGDADKETDSFSGDNSGDSSGDFSGDFFDSSSGAVDEKEKKTKSVTGSKKDNIMYHKQKEKTQNSSKKNSVVIRRPPIIYHPPPEVYHRPDIVVHRPPIVMYRAPIVYHQPPVVVHRPAIVYHQPPIVFHQPPPIVHQPVMQSHDTWVTKAVAVPYTSHLEHVATYHGVPHESMFMHGYGTGAFSKSHLPSNKRSKIKKKNIHSRNRKTKRSSREDNWEETLYETPDITQPVGAGRRIARKVADPWSSFQNNNLDIQVREPIGAMKRILRETSDPWTSFQENNPDVRIQQPIGAKERIQRSIDDHTASSEEFALHGNNMLYSGLTKDRRDVSDSLNVSGAKVSVSARTRIQHAVSSPWVSYATDILQNTGEEEHPLGAGKRIQRAVQESLTHYHHDIQRKRPIGAGDRIRRAIDDPWSFLHADLSQPYSDKTTKKTKRSKYTPSAKKTITVVHRPPIIWHPPGHIIHPPSIMVHRPPLIMHRHPLIFHRPPVLVHRPPIIIHRHPILIRRPPIIMHRPPLIIHRHPYIIHRMPYIVHPRPFIIRRPPVIFHHGPHYLVHHSHYVHHYPMYMMHQRMMHMHPFGKSEVSRVNNATVNTNTSDANAKDAHDNGEQHPHHSNKHKQNSKASTVSDKPSKSKRSAVGHSEKRRLQEPNKGKNKKDVVVNRPPIIYHPPPEVYHRPDIVVHRAPIMIHRPPIVYHQPPVVVHRPAVVYHQPPIVFHQPAPAVSQPLLYSHDSFVMHPAAIATHLGSIVNDGGKYIGIPHGTINNYPEPLPHAHFGGIMMRPNLNAGFAGKRTTVAKPENKENENQEASGNDEASGEADSNNFQDISGDTESSGESDNPAGKSSNQGKAAKKNKIIIQRPPMIYHPPPEIYDRPNIVVHRPDLVYHQPSIVYHQPSVVVHRPPIIYRQPPVVFHQPPPLTKQPIVHAHDMYTAQPVFTPHHSEVHHAMTYLGAPHMYSGIWGWGAGWHGHGHGHGHGDLHRSFGWHGEAHGRSKVERGPKEKLHFGSQKSHKASNSSRKRKKRSAETKHREKARHHQHHHKHRHLGKHHHHRSKIRHHLGKNNHHYVLLHKRHHFHLYPGHIYHWGNRRHMVVLRRPPIVYYRSPEIHPRPDIVFHRPDLIYHRPTLMFQQPPTVVHHSSIYYHSPPVVFHNAPPMVTTPILHSHDVIVPQVKHMLLPQSTFVKPLGAYTGIPYTMQYHGGYKYYASNTPIVGRSHLDKPPASIETNDTKTVPVNSTVNKAAKDGSHSKDDTLNITDTDVAEDSSGSGEAETQVHTNLKKSKSRLAKAEKKQDVLIQSPPVVFQPQPDVFRNPPVIVHQPPVVVHRPPVIVHQPPLVIDKPPIIYHRPPLVMPALHLPVYHARPGYLFHGFHYGKSKVPKSKKTNKSKKKHKVQRGDKKSNIELKGKHITKNVSGKKKNKIVIYRPPMIYHPPPEVYHRPNIIVHRPDVVVHRPSIVYHQPSVVVHRPPIVYRQPPVVFHQPAPMVHQPIMHAHDTYIAHPVPVPYTSNVYHAATYVGAPHHYPGGWGWGYGYGHGHAFGKSHVEKTEATTKSDSKDEMEEQRGPSINYKNATEKENDGLHEKKHSKRDLSSQEVKRSVKKNTTELKGKHIINNEPGKKKNKVVIYRPPMIYHPPPEVYHRPDVIVHRPDVVVHRPSIVYHQPSVVVHRPPIVYRQPPVVFHQPAPMVHQPIMHAHDTYIAHPVPVPYTSNVYHAATYVGAPHHYPGGWGWGYGYGHGHAFGKSHVEKTEATTKSDSKDEMEEQRGPSINYKNATEKENDGLHEKKHSKRDLSSQEVKRSVKKNTTELKGKHIINNEPGKKKNKVVIYRPPMIYHPPPEVYHRPDVIVHRPDVVVHRPSIVYHQPSVVVHRPPIVYRQPPVVFHQPAPMVHQPIMHAHETYIAHPVPVPYTSNVYHAATYVGAPHHYPGGWGYGYGHGHAFGKSHVEKTEATTNLDSKEVMKEQRSPSINHKNTTEKWSKKLHIKKHSKRDLSSQEVKRSLKGNTTELKGKHITKNVPGKKKNKIVIYRPPMIYHPPPEVYHRPDVIVHRPDVVVHRPSIVYHQPSVVVHRPPIIYRQPPVVFHQPAPMVHQPIMHAHDTYIAHPVPVPYTSNVYHAATYVGAPHHYPGGWGWGYGYGHGHAFGKSHVEKAKATTKSDSKDKNNEQRGSSINHKSTTEKENDRLHEKKYSKRDLTSQEVQRSVKKSTTELRGKHITENEPGKKKNKVVIYRPPMIYHPPPEVYHRPDVIVHRPDVVVHRPSIVYHQPSVVVHRPPIVYRQPPVVFHQPAPMVHQPIMHAHDTYIAHPVPVPYTSNVYHAATYVGAPHHYPGGWGWGYGYGHGHAFGKSHVEKTKATTNFDSKEEMKKRRGPSVNHKTITEEENDGLHEKKLSKRSASSQDKKARTGTRKNQIIIQRPPMIYHPPPEIYDKPDVIVHRPDIVVHRPSIVYHQPSVVVHRPPIIYRQPPVVFHQPPPMTQQPIVHAHDTYVAHPVPVPYASHIHHVGTYSGAPHYYPGSWGYGYGYDHVHHVNHVAGPAFAKSQVPSHKKTKLSNTSRKSVGDGKKIERRSIKDSNLKTSGTKTKKGARKNAIFLHRPPIIYHPPPEVYHRPSIVVHRPNIVIHRPSIVYHQPPVVVHRPAIVYRQPPVVFHQPPPMVRQPILHAHDTYLAHPIHVPYSSHIHHTATYLGAPHYYHGGWGYGFGYGHAFGKSRVEKKHNKTKQTQKDGGHVKSHKKVKREVNGQSNKTSVNSKSKGSRKNVIVMRRPPVIYHPPPEVYHRPSIILHRPDIVIHRPSVVFHQSAVIVHRPPVIYRQPPIVFHQPPPMVHQPIFHSHETYLAHPMFTPWHSHLHHFGTYLGAPHHFPGGWGWGWHHHGFSHAFGKSKIVSKDSTKKKNSKETLKDRTKNQKVRRDVKENDSEKILQADGILSNQDKTNDRKEDKKNKESEKGVKKNKVIIQRPALIYHPPPEIYDKPDIIVHRADYVFHRPSVVYHQPSVVIHRPPIVYRAPPIVFHQPPPMVKQPIAHAHDTYIAQPTFVPYKSDVQHTGTYLGAPHYYPGGWGYGWSYGGPYHYGYGSGFLGNNAFGLEGFGPEYGFRANGPPYWPMQNYWPTPQLTENGAAYSKSSIEKTMEKKKEKQNSKDHEKIERDSKMHNEKDIKQKIKNKRHRRHLTENVEPHKSSNRTEKLKGAINKSKKGARKNVVIMHRPPLIYHPPAEVYHRPSIVMHRPDIVIHRPSVVYHQAPVVVHRPSIVYRQPPIVFHQPPPLVHQPILHSHEHYLPHPVFVPHASHLYHTGTYVGAPHFYPGGWGWGHGHPGFGYSHAWGKSHVEKNKKSKHNKKRFHKKDEISKKEKNAEDLHPQRERDENPSKKNSIVVSRPPIIYHPPPEIYHRPDIVVHRAPIMLHRPPIIYHQPPVIVHRPAVVYHQPPIVFHQPPPAVHQQILHSHDTFLYRPAAHFESHGSVVGHTTHYVGIPSNVRDFGFEGFHGFHGLHGLHGLHYRSEIGKTNPGQKRKEKKTQTKSTISKPKVELTDFHSLDGLKTTAITDDNSEKKTLRSKVTKRQVSLLGSHSLFESISPLNKQHSTRETIEVPQKLSSTPGGSPVDVRAKLVRREAPQPRNTKKAPRDKNRAKAKRQVNLQPYTTVLPLTLPNSGATEIPLANEALRMNEGLHPGIIGGPYSPEILAGALAREGVAHAVPQALNLVGRPPLSLPLINNFSPAIPPLLPKEPSPDVNVHVETARSGIPTNYRGGRKKRQVPVVFQPQVVRATPHELFNPNPIVPFSPIPQVFPESGYHLPYNGLYHPELSHLISPYIYSPLAEKSRPNVNINVQASRSNVPKVPNSQQDEKPLSKRSEDYESTPAKNKIMRKKRQAFGLTEAVNPLLMNNLFPRYLSTAVPSPMLHQGSNTYGSLYPLPNPFPYRQAISSPFTGGISPYQDDNDRDIKLGRLWNDYMNFLSSTFLGHPYYHPRPHVNVDVQTSKSKIARPKKSKTKKESRIFKRQLYNYIPLSPLTNGRFMIPFENPTGITAHSRQPHVNINVITAKRNKIPKPNQSKQPKVQKLKKETYKEETGKKRDDFVANSPFIQTIQPEEASSYAQLSNSFPLIQQPVSQLSMMSPQVSTPQITTLPTQQVFGDRPHVTVNVQTSKKSTFNGGNKKKTAANHKRQSITVLHRLPVMQVLPQTFLQNGAVIPEFNTIPINRQIKSNGMLISELQKRKHLIPNVSKMKNDAEKLQRVDSLGNSFEADDGTKTKDVKLSGHSKRKGKSETKKKQVVASIPFLFRRPPVYSDLPDYKMTDIRLKSGRRPTLDNNIRIGSFLIPPFQVPYRHPNRISVHVEMAKRKSNLKKKSDSLAIEKETPSLTSPDVSHFKSQEKQSRLKLLHRARVSEVTKQTSTLKKAFSKKINKKQFIEAPEVIFAQSPEAMAAQPFPQEAPATTESVANEQFPSHRTVSVKVEVAKRKSKISDKTFKTKQKENDRRQFIDAMPRFSQGTDQLQPYAVSNLQEQQQQVEGGESVAAENQISPEANQDQLRLPAQIVQQGQQVLNPSQPPLQSYSQPGLQSLESPLMPAGLDHHSSVNINIQTAKSKISSPKHKLVTHKQKVDTRNRRQLFGTVPLLNPLSHIIPKHQISYNEGRSDVPNSSTDNSIKHRRQAVNSDSKSSTLSLESPTEIISNEKKMVKRSKGKDNSNTEMKSLSKRQFYKYNVQDGNEKESGVTTWNSQVGENLNLQQGRMVRPQQIEGNAPSELQSQDITAVQQPLLVPQQQQQQQIIEQQQPQQQMIEQRQPQTNAENRERMPLTMPILAQMQPQIPPSQQLLSNYAQQVPQMTFPSLYSTVQQPQIALGAPQPKVSVNIQTAKSNVPKIRTKLPQNNKKESESVSLENLSNSQAINRAEANVKKTEGKSILTSLTSASKENSKKENSKAKRQLRELLSGLLERRRILGDAKSKKPGNRFMFTSNRNKPIEIVSSDPIEIGAQDSLKPRIGGLGLANGAGGLFPEENTNNFQAVNFAPKFSNPTLNENNLPLNVMATVPQQGTNLQRPAAPNVQGLVTNAVPQLQAIPRQEVVPIFEANPNVLPNNNMVETAPAPSQLTNFVQKGIVQPFPLISNPPPRILLPPPQFQFLPVEPLPQMRPLPMEIPQGPPPIGPLIRPPFPPPPLLNPPLPQQPPFPVPFPVPLENPLAGEIQDEERPSVHVTVKTSKSRIPKAHTSDEASPVQKDGKAQKT